MLVDVPEPTIGINDVLIRVDRTGICGTDVHIDDWNAWAQDAVTPPLVVGHEFVGEIVDVGSNVERLPRRATSSRARATSSAAGAATAWRGGGICARRRERRRQPTGRVRGVHRAADDQRLAPRPAIDRDVAAIFDPFGNAVHSALPFAVLGEDVLITGAGPIGLMACAVAQHAGARYVVVTDVNPYRLELAKTLGATRRARRAASDRRRRAARARHEGGLRRRPGDERQPRRRSTRCSPTCATAGKIAMLGLPDRPFAIDWNLVIHDMLTIKGMYGREMYETWYMMTVMLQGGLDVRP